MSRLAWTIAVVLSCLFATFSPAQEQPKNKGPMQPNPWMYKRPGNNGSPFPPGVETEPLKGSGTIKELGAGGVMKVASSDGELFIAISPQAKVSYTGSADPSWLQPSMFVRFTGSYDKKGKPASTIMSLEVFTPTPMTKPGVQGGVGSNDFAGAGELFKDTSAAPKKPVEPETASYTIVGRLASIRNGKFTVQAGATTILGELDERAKVSFDLAGMQGVKVNDKIDFDGTVAVNQKTHVWVRTATFSASEPLSGTKKRPITEKSEGAPSAEKGTKPAEAK